ncbi:MAG TPA: asparagine synthase (glutamine-hydrolyzing), partial [Opitutaceae bacterium]|nr:asparagine synthase (glutamine-hydrolyzing) [Opitutaceae bacterium]
MCGIAGYFGPGKMDQSQVLAQLAHRGPDGSGVWEEVVAPGARVSLAHTRLSILDRSSASAQPMGWTPEEAIKEELVLVYNGEIYNFAALRHELASLGHTFRSTGDTEVVLKAYAAWGDNAFARFDGMFALALFDRRRGALVLARDPLGIKPLYVGRGEDGSFVFASEVQALIRTSLCSKEIDSLAIADYLRLGSFQEPATLYRSVRAFPAGHVGEVSLTEGCPAPLRQKPYWLPECLSSSRWNGDTESWREEHKRVLDEAIKGQLQADVPVAVFLSGGLDSTLLLERAVACGGQRSIGAFTLGGAAAEQDEAERARATAHRLGVTFTRVDLDDATLHAWVASALSSLDQPSGDGVNLALVSRAAREAGWSVALAGTGADELHGAYGHAVRLDRLRRLLERGGPAALQFLKQWGRWRWGRGSLDSERWRLLLAASPESGRMLREKRRYFTPTEVADIWPGSESWIQKESEPITDVWAFQQNGWVEQIRLSEICGYLRNTLLRDADAVTMAHGQELRVPFL